MESTVWPSLAAPESPARRLRCPACGYDLRGSTGGRCSECGLDLDAAELNRSGIPWACRSAIGGATAFRQTVWRITLDAKALRFEAAKPQAPHDAAVFRRWVTALVAASLIGLAAFGVAHDVVEDLVIQQPSAFQALTARTLSGIQQDLRVPWSAGIAIPGALYAYAVLAAVCMAAAPAAVLRASGMSPEQAEAARALGRYVAAPLAWAPLAVAPLVLALWIDVDLQHSKDLRALWNVFSGLYPVATVIWVLVALAAVGGTVLRTGQWRARTTHAGFATGFLAMCELLLRWVVGLVAILSIVPWCVGFLWIVLDSFRR